MCVAGMKAHVMQMVYFTRDAQMVYFELIAAYNDELSVTLSATTLRNELILLMNTSSIFGQPRFRTLNLLKILPGVA